MKNSQEKKYSVMIVDDHPLFCTALQTWISEYEYFHHTGTFNSGEKLLQIIDSDQPDIIFMDIEMKGIDGIQTTEAVMQKYPNIKIVGVSMHAEGSVVQRMFDAGAIAYLTKDISPEIFNNAIESILKGQRYVAPQASTNYALHRINGENPSLLLKLFSGKEIDVIGMIAEGMSDKEIGQQMGLSVRTVHAHKRRIKFKLGKQKTTEIVAFAFKSGMIRQ
jgi:DNA-binding NarL/FixJ family response regulator